MKLEFSYTFDDYREANRAHARMNKVRWLTRMFFTMLFLLVACLMLTLLVVSSATPQTGEIGWANIKPILPWLVICGAFIVWSVAASSIALRRAWRGQPAMQLQQSLEISDRGVVVDDVQSRIEYSWNAFMRLLETRNLFLLFPSKLAFIMIPKRAVPRGEVDALRLMLGERVGHTGGFPVHPSPPPGAQQS